MHWNIKFGKFDWGIVISILILSFFSLSFLYYYDYFFFKKQLLWFLITFLIIFLSFKIKWELFISSTFLVYAFYFFCVFLLIISHLQGNVVRGTKSWLSLGFLNLEPAELSKLALILVLSNFFAKRYLAAWRTNYLLISLGIVLLPAFIIILHPDLGSVLIMLGIWLTFVVWGGINKKRFILGLIIFIIIAILSWNFVLKDYQKARVISFIFPERDPLGSSYNVIQSKIAIGNGGFWGKGLGKGTQTQFGFLPEAHTDFIFSALGEEFGFWGATIILLTFLYLFYRLLDIALLVSSNNLRFIILGTQVLLIIQVFVNIGSSLGMIPVTGVTLPFVSYGGSSLLTLGILFSIIERIKLII